MGLALLLTVGKSLRVARDVPHRYRMRRGKSLAGLEPGPQAKLRNQAMKQETDNGGNQSVRIDSIQATEETGAEGAPGVEPAAVVAGEAGSARPWWRIGFRWPLERWGLKRARPTKRFSSNLAGTPVQQELALEKVKPCRNDLSDTDWELAAPPSRGARLAFLKNLAHSGTSGSSSARLQPGEILAGPV